MNVLVDTPVWSMAFRRDPLQRSEGETLISRALAELIRENRARLIGAVLQELLSGIRDEYQFDELRQKMREFADLNLEVEDYEEAARANNACRARGIAGSGVDFLICAVAMRRQWLIFTIDKDFDGYSRHLAIKLLKPE